MIDKSLKDNGPMTSFFVIYQETNQISKLETLVINTVNLFGLSKSFSGIFHVKREFFNFSNLKRPVRVKCVNFLSIVVCYSKILAVLQF